MFLLKESEIVNLAMKRTGLNQAEFSKLIGKSQGQISKYLSVASKPTSKIYIHCMNIISKNSEISNNYLDLLFEVSKLEDEEHSTIRSALLEMINAYNSKK
jgi:transcriptional regulator with XRE-family HTH domain